MVVAGLYPNPFDPAASHDYNAAIIAGPQVYAYEEGKLTGIKSEPTVRSPERSLMLGLKELGLKPHQVDLWAFSQPSRPVSPADFKHFFDMLKAYDGTPQDYERWFAEHVVLVPHQLGHAALGVYASPFEDCAFLCMDGGGGGGDSRNYVFGEFDGAEFTVIREASGYRSLGTFHKFVTDALGFNALDSGKTSGLAGYGRVIPELERAFLALAESGADGVTFALQRFGRTATNPHKASPQEFDRNKVYYSFPSDNNVLRMCLEYLPHDVARTAEEVLKTICQTVLQEVRTLTKKDKLVVSGGLFQNVALNCFIRESKVFASTYFPMAASDAGLGLGMAYYAAVKRGRAKKTRTTCLTPLIGPSFETTETEKLLKRFRLNYSVDKDIAKTVATLIAEGHVVGWFQGRAEYGPRSLGARSICADPRCFESKLRINQLLKKRDWFMPYAPSILKERVAEWVGEPVESPYMQVAFKLRAGSEQLIPAAIHVDGTSRVHVVTREENPKYWLMIHEFEALTGIPVVLNTSFNRHGISTISSPRQAVEHLLEGCMDYLAIDDFLISVQDNRRFNESPVHVVSEEVALQQDCIRRLKVFESFGDQTQLANYCQHLSRLLGVEITTASRQLSFLGERYSLADGVERLLQTRTPEDPSSPRGGADVTVAVPYARSSSNLGVTAPDRT